MPERIWPFDSGQLEARRRERIRAFRTWAWVGGSIVGIWVVVLLIAVALLRAGG